MSRPAKKLCVSMLLCSILATTGCQPMQPYYLRDDGGELTHFLDVATQIEYTDVCQEPLAEVRESHAPRTIENAKVEEFWDLPLEEAVQIALHNSKVVRTLGPLRQFGQVIGGAPERLSSGANGVATIYDVAIQETGQSGVEQALSTFDAIFSSTATWDNTDRGQNTQITNTINAPIFQQDVVNFENEITKLSADGTQWFFRNVSTYTGSNNLLTRQTRQVPSDWLTAFEAEFRRPLLRNRGAQVNRIPVVLARIRTDLSLIDFQSSVAELLNSVERAYWELYFFYHQLNAAKQGRDSALASWQKVQALYEAGSPGGEAEREAQAKEQYFTFQDRVEQAQNDLFKVETRLRYLMGLAPTDPRFIRPSDKPTHAKVAFDWNMVVEEAAAKSPALRRQGWNIKAREMELIAARNQLLPQFDAIALYRWLGQGDRWSSNAQDPANVDPTTGGPLFPLNAVDNLFSGDRQEFRVGFDFNMPLGLRREMSQVRSSQLALARERARLHDMELEGMHILTDAMQDLSADYRSVNTVFQRRVAAEEQVKAVEASYLAGTAPLDLLLDAQRRQADATIAYYQSLINYNLSILNMHLRKGSIFEYHGVVLGEGPWPAKAYFDATNQARRRDASHYLNYGYSRPNVISRGPVKDRWSGNSQLDTGEGDYYPEPSADSMINLSSDPADDAYDSREDLDDSDDAADLTRDLEESLKSLDGGSEDLPRLKDPRMPDQNLDDSLPRSPFERSPQSPEVDDLEASRRVRTATRGRRSSGPPRRRATTGGSIHSSDSSGVIDIDWN